MEGAMVEFGNITADLSSIIGGAATMYSDTFIDPVQANFDQFSQLQTLPSANAESADDFILRPGQPALKFNKDDLIIGGTNLEGEKNNSSEGVSEKLKQELQELKQIMSGFVEQMSQVVNRPITVELNGNKVGQALGQDSYRIQ
jgi:hypothetical protein